MNQPIDDYAHLDSLIHRWHPKPKLIGLLALIFAIATVEKLALLPVVLGITVILFVLSQLPLSFLQRRMRYPGFFLLGIVLLLPWLSGDTVLWQWGWLTLRQEGLLAVVLIASRFLCILTVGIVLLGTMPFLTTIKAMRSLGLPHLMADMTLLTYRYLYEVANNLATMRRAMRLRGFGQGHRYRIQRRLTFVPDVRDLNLLASLTGSLFIRSYEQSEQIYKSMRLRGYGQSAERLQSKDAAQRFKQQQVAAIAPDPPLPSGIDTLMLISVLAIALTLVVLSLL